MPRCHTWARCLPFPNVSCKMLGMGISIVPVSSSALPGWAVDRREGLKGSIHRFRYLGQDSISACMNVDNLEHLLMHVSRDAASKGIEHPRLNVFGMRSESQGILISNIDGEKVSFPVSYFVPPDNRADGETDVEKVSKRESGHLEMINATLKERDVILPFTDDFKTNESKIGSGLFIQKQSAVIRRVESVLQELSTKYGVGTTYTSEPLIDHSSPSPEKVDISLENIDEMLKTPNTYDHTHCKGGVGRSLGRVLRKIMYTAATLPSSYEKFIETIRLTLDKNEGSSILGTSKKTFPAERIANNRKRDDELRSFFTYAQERKAGNHNLPYSTWLKSSQGRETVEAKSFPHEIEPLRSLAA